MLKRRPLLRASTVLLLVAAALGLSAASAAADTPPATPVIASGVTVAGVDVAGLSPAAAVTKVRAALRGTPFYLHVGVRSFRLAADRAVEAAFVVTAVTQAATLTAPGNVPVRVRVNGAVIHRFVFGVAPRVYRAPVSARWRWFGTRPQIMRAHPGLRLNRAAAIARLTAVAARGDHRVVRGVRLAVRPAVTWSMLPPVIHISRAGHRLYLWKPVSAVGRLIHVFGVAVGRPQYPTPTGHFSIVTMQRNPWWYPPNSVWAQGAKPIPPGPGNPLGTRWMGLSASGVGIHGTPDAGSIGYSASHGCIRMRIPDAEWLFDHVRVGTPVLIS